MPRWMMATASDVFIHYPLWMMSRYRQTTEFCSILLQDRGFGHTEETYGGNKYRLRNGMICRSDIEKQSRAILKVTGNGSHSPVMSLRSSRVLPMGYSGSRWHGYARYDKGIGRHGLSRMRTGA